MAEQRDGEQVIRSWHEHRPYLVDLAFRMLGDIGAAEDVVQDAFARLLRTPRGEIEDDRGWLIVVTSRLCLDQIRSARSRRERPHDASEIEFVPGGQPGRPLVGQQPAADPADRTAGATVNVGAAEHRQVTEKFIAACASGDLDGLLAVLAPGAWGDFDAGPGGKPPGVIHGALRVARHLLHYWGPDTTLVTHPVAGHPALLGFTGRELSGVLVLTVAGERIQAVHVIGDPRKLSAIGAQLA